MPRRHRRRDEGSRVGLGPGPEASMSERVTWWQEHYKAEKRAQRDWTVTRFDRGPEDSGLADAVVALIAEVGIARVEKEPADEGPYWQLRITPPGGEPVVALTLGEAQPYCAVTPFP